MDRLFIDRDLIDRDLIDRDLIDRFIEQSLNFLLSEIQRTLDYSALHYNLQITPNPSDALTQNALSASLQELDASISSEGIQISQRHIIRLTCKSI
jgi:hypothetical protein